MKKKADFYREENYSDETALCGSGRGGNGASEISAG